FAEDRRRAGVYAGVFAVAGGVSYALLDVATNGAFFAYVFAGHQHHAFHAASFLVYVFHDTLLMAPLVLLLPLAWAWVFARGSLATILATVQTAMAVVLAVLKGGEPSQMYLRDLSWGDSKPLLVFVPAAIFVVLALGLPRVAPENGRRALDRHCLM